MARVCKSLTQPEQGYAHRDHRSKRNRKGGYRGVTVARKLKKSVIEADRYEAEMIEAREFFE